ncbi:MAG: PTS ascorbate transporter subunit IIC [Ruminococcus sp.]|nr:PTS ascorbate transporter subunit IIC [Ruminococcus sp.]MCD7801166.1 PTS ascorbate transporter subunit IIC [Ruminococcus sp.]
MAESKKQVPLRLSAKLYAELSEWAENDFRSVNGQIEYLLTECVKYRKRKSKYNSNVEKFISDEDT